MTYTWLKLIHIIAAILWSASAIGAFWFVVAAWWERKKDPDDPELERRDDWVRWHFSKIVIVEHLALIVLLPSGWLVMESAGFSLDSPWLVAKLAIVGLVFVPLEIADCWLSHVQVPRAHVRRHEQPAAYAHAVKLHNGLLAAATVIVAVGIPAVLWLVVVKPSLG